MDYLDVLEHGGEKQERRGTGRKGVRTGKTRGHRGCTGRCGMCSFSISHKSRVRMRKHKFDEARIEVDVVAGRRTVALYVTSSKPAEVKAAALRSFRYSRY